MDTNVNYTAVGAFVIALITAIILGIIWLSSGFSFEKYSTYVAYMQESVSGLSIDAPVEFNGVNVGSVKSIDLDHKNPHLVDVIFSIKSNTPVSQNTIAILTTRGITGITYIALKDDGKDLTPLVRQHGERYPSIKTGPSLFERLDSTLKQLSTNLRQVTHSIQQVLDQDNLASIRATLKNLQQVTGTLAGNSKRMDGIFANMEHASLQLGPFMQSGTGAMRMLQMQTLPLTYRTLSNIEVMTRNLSAATAMIKDNPSVLIRGTQPAALGPGEKK